MFWCFLCYQRKKNKIFQFLTTAFTSLYNDPPYSSQANFSVILKPFNALQQVDLKCATNSLNDGLTFS